MKIQASSPARAACAATAFARFPVDAQPTTSRPNAWAALIAVDTTRSLNDSVGMRHAVVLDPEACNAEATGERWRFDERREAGVRRERRDSIEREPFVVAPQRRRAARDRLAIGQRAARVVLRHERPEAVEADRARLGIESRAAVRADEREGRDGRR